jgi:hypothetical protein
VQQRQGRVPTTSRVGGVPANEDPALEQEADRMGAKVALAERPADPSTTHATAPQHTQPVQMKMEVDADHSAAPAGPHVTELAEPDAVAPPEAASGPPIQRKPGPEKRRYIPFKILQELEKARVLEQKAAEAVEKAAAARAAYKAAKGELGQALGKAYSLPGPLTDPEVYRALLKMALAKIQQGGHSLAAFVAELRQARIQARLAAELNPEELAKVKQAWEEAEALAKSAETPVDLVDEAGEIFGRYQHGSQLEVLSKKKLHGGNTIKLDDHATTTITGTLDDTDSIARRGIKLPGATVMGENQGGINILRSPKWGEIKTKHLPLLDTQGETAYWKAVTDEFWESVNKPWLDEAIARGDHFRFVSNPNEEKALFVLSKNKRSFVLDNGKKIQSIFGREVEYLKANGYVFRLDGTAVREP